MNARESDREVRRGKRKTIEQGEKWRSTCNKRDSRRVKGEK